MNCGGGKRPVNVDGVFLCQTNRYFSLFFENTQQLRREEPYSVRSKKRTPLFYSMAEMSFFSFGGESCRMKYMVSNGKHW